MAMVCAWCAAAPDVDAGADGPVSHGLCGCCAAKLLVGVPVEVARLVDQGMAPVLVVDGAGRVLGANRAAQRLGPNPCGEDGVGRRARENAVERQADGVLLRVDSVAAAGAGAGGVAASG